MKSLELWSILFLGLNIIEIKFIIVCYIDSSVEDSMEDSGVQSGMDLMESQKVAISLCVLNTCCKNYKCKKTVKGYTGRWGSRKFPGSFLEISSTIHSHQFSSQSMIVVPWLWPKNWYKHFCSVVVLKFCPLEAGILQIWPQTRILWECSSPEPAGNV